MMAEIEYTLNQNLVHEHLCTKMTMNIQLRIKFYTVFHLGLHAECNGDGV